MSPGRRSRTARKSRRSGAVKSAPLLPMTADARNLILQEFPTLSTHANAREYRGIFAALSSSHHVERTTGRTIVDGATVAAAVGVNVRNRAFRST